MSPPLTNIALWLADIHILTAALLAVALAAMLAARQPARRMAIAKSTLAALAILAVLCALPGWSIVHLLAPVPEPTNELAAVGNAPSATTDLPNPATLATTALDRLPTDAFPATPAPQVAAPPQSQIVEAPLAIDWPATGLAIQAIGSTIILLYLASGGLYARRLRRRATEAPAALHQLLAPHTRPSAAPQLLISSEVAAPVALGTRRPAIILPAALLQPRALAGGSPDDDQRAATPGQSPGLNSSQLLSPILAHEWAHIAAGDLHTLAANRLLLILLWPQPLFWLLRRLIRLDQETLADAAAASVAGRVRYAEQLLGLARTAAASGPTSAPRLAGAVGLWEGPSQLKRRIAALLDEKLTVLRDCSRRWRIGAACSAVAAAGLLSLVTLQRQERAQAATQPAAAPATPSSASNATSGTDAEGKLPTHLITVRGRAADSDGKPIPGATIYLASPRTNPKPLAQTTTAADGSYEFRDAPLPIQPPRDNLSRAEGAFEVFGLADGHAFAYRPLKWFRPNEKHYDEVTFPGPTDRPHAFGTEDNIDLDLTFSRPQSLRGRIVDDAGQPIAGAELAIRYLSPAPAEGYASREEFSIMSPSSECESFNERAVVPPAFKTRATDADGRFEFTQLPENVRFRMDVGTKDLPGRSEWAATIDGLKKYEGGKPIHFGEMNLTLRRPNDVPIRVVFDDTSEPAPKVFVEASNSEAGMWKPSDADGRVELRLPPGTYKVHLTPRYRTPYLRTEGAERAELVVGDEPPAEPHTYRLRRAAEVTFTVTDAATGKPLAGVDLWNMKRSDRAAGRTYRETVGYRSYEQETNISHYDEPRTDASGVGHAQLEPGLYVLGVANEAYPKGYEPVAAEREGKEVVCVAGQTAEITFEMQRVAAPSGDALIPLRGPIVGPEQPAVAEFEPLQPTLDAAPGAFPTRPALPHELPAWARLEPNVVKGQVVDDAGKPLAGVSVSLIRYQMESANTLPVIEYLQRGTSAADGTYRFENVVDVAKRYPNGLPNEMFQPPPIAVVNVMRTLDGRSPDWSSSTEVSVAKHGEAGRSTLKPVATLRGRITGPDGRPVRGAAVRAGLDPLPKLSLRNTTTDADGRYEINDLFAYDAAKTRAEIAEALKQHPEAAASVSAYAGSVSLFVTHPDFAVGRVEIAAVPGELDIQLKAGAVIEGVVTLRDADGTTTPAANIPVGLIRELLPAAAGQPVDLYDYQINNGRTDEQGRYRFASLPAGRYRLIASTPQWVSLGLEGVEAVAEKASSAPELVLTRGGSVRLKLVDADTGKPLALPNGSRGWVNPFRRPPLPQGISGLAPGGVEFNDASATIPMPAGDWSFLVQIPGADANAAAWVSTNNATLTTDAAHTVVEGQAIEVTVPMAKVPNVPAGTLRAAPVANNGAAPAAGAPQNAAPPNPTIDFHPATPPADGN